MTKSYLHTVYLSLGTNLGEKQVNLSLAIEYISKKCGAVIGKSGVYISPAWGYESENEFYNQCLNLETKLEPDQLLDALLSIEEDMGRIRAGSSGVHEKSASPGYADRIMDIDILFYDNIGIHADKLIVPHPRITERRFVLAPLAELAPEFVHPFLNLRMKVLLEKCKDMGPARRI